MLHALLVHKQQLVASLQDPHLQCALPQKSSKLVSPCYGVPWLLSALCRCITFTVFPSVAGNALEPEVQAWLDLSQCWS